MQQKRLSKRGGISPTQRTLAFLKEEGYLVSIVERWIPIPSFPGGGQRKDMFGIIDIIALDLKNGRCLGIQSTGSAYSEHFKKITGEGKEMAIAWLSIPCHDLYLYGWRKIKKVRGGKQMVWSPRIYKFELKDFE